MQYMLLIFTEEIGWHQLTPEVQKEWIGAYEAYVEALKNANAFVDTKPLRNSATATTVRVVDGKNQVLDGPFADSKEQLAGYFIIEAPDLDSAIAWAARCPGARHGTIEVRPIERMPSTEDM